MRTRLPILLATCLIAASPAFASTDLFRPVVSVGFEGLEERHPATVLRRSVVALDPRQVVNGGRGAPELSLELFPGVELRATLNRFEQPSAQTSHWHGRAVDDFASMVVLTVADGRLFGSVVYQGRRYAIAWLPSGNYSIAEVDLAALPPEDPLFSRREDPIMFKGSTPPPKFPSGMSFDSEIDIMVLWSSEIEYLQACWMYSELALLGLLDCHRYVLTHPTIWKAIIEDVLIPHAIAESNTVFANSGLGTPLNLVKALPVAYAGSGDLELDTNRLAGTGDGYLEYVPGARNGHQADLVMLVTYNSDPSLCGNAQGPPSISIANSMVAYGVVSAECLLNGNFTFVHEVAHLMGAHHDWYVFADLGIGGTGAPPKKYAHGYTQMPSGLMTVMAYPHECVDKGGFICARVPFFSDGGAWGEPETAARPANNAKALSEALSTIANYR